MKHLCRWLARAGAALVVALGSGSALAVEVGETAPPLTAALVEGSALKLASLRGQVVYVDFWASWCAPCMQALPALDRLYKAHRDRGFTVLAVNVDTERAAATKVLERLKPGFPVALDPQGSWPEAFALRGMPSSYLVGRDGVVRYIKTGYKTHELPDIEKEILRELERAK